MKNPLNLLIIAVSLLGVTSTQAVNRNWVGGASTNTWSQAANWSPAGVPANGDELTFGLSSGVPTFNDLVGLRLGSLSVGHGDTLSGNSIVLSNGILCTAIGANINRINLDIELAKSQSFECGEGNLMFGGVVDVNGYLLTLDPFDNPILTGSTLIEVDESGLITGAGSVLILAPNLGGSGHVKLSGAIGVSGGVTVYGEVHLSSNFGPSLLTDLEIMSGGSVRFDDGDQISLSSSLSIRVHSGGELSSLSIVANRVPNLRLDGGSLVTISDNGGMSTPGLIWTTNLTVFATNSTAQITGSGNFGFTNSTPVDVQGSNAELAISAKIVIGGFEKLGPGRVVLSGTNSYPGVTKITQGVVEVQNAQAFGSISGATICNGGDIHLEGVAVGNESLIVDEPSTILCHAASSWAGSVILNANLDAKGLSGELVFSGAISGAGDISVVGDVRYTGSGANTYTGTTKVQDETSPAGGRLHLQKSASITAIPGPLVVGLGLSSLPKQIVQSLASAVIANNVPITVKSDGRLDLNNFTDAIGSLTLTGGEVTTGTGVLTLGGDLTAQYLASISGNLNLGGTTRTINISNASLDPGLTISAAVTSGGIAKTGPGTLLLNGANTYAAETLVREGVLKAGHTSALGSSSGVTVVSNGATLRIIGGTLNVPETIVLNGSGSGGTNGSLHGEGISQAVGDIVMNAPSTIGADGSSFQIGGEISGTGPLTKIGSGTLTMNGSVANVYSGATYVNEGVLELGRPSGVTCIPDDLIIGTGPFGNPATVRHLLGASNVIGNFVQGSGNIIVNGGGTYDLNGQFEGFDAPPFGSSTPIILYDGGDAQTGSGRLTLPGSAGLYVDPGFNGSSTFSGRIGLSSGSHNFTVHSRTALSSTPELTLSAALEAITGTASLTKSGNGHMRVSGNNTFTGVMNVNDGRVTLANANAAGAAGGGVNVNNDAELEIDGSLLIDGEPLILNTTNSSALSVLVGNSTWDSTIALNKDANIDVSSGASLRVLNALSGNAALIKSGLGTLAFGGSTANTFTNATIVNAGTLVLSNTAVNATILGPLVIGDGIGGVNADVVRLGRVRQIANPVAVTINSSGLLDLNGYSDAFGSLAGSGNVVMPGPADLETGLDNTSTAFDGNMSGSANFWKHGTGTQTLTGTNSYTGLTIVEGGGKLIVNGSQQQSPVIISNSATLGGSGIVGHITAASSATVSPGSSAGTLTCSNATFNTGSTFRVELNGPSAGSGYDQLNARGTVILSNATLNATLGFAPTAGVPLTIINNDGVDAITSMFNGLPNNSFLTIGGLLFQIRYNGGSGNDVTLTYTNPVSLASLMITSGNGSGGIDPNECNLINVVLTNGSAVIGSNVTTKLISETPGVIVTQPFSTYPNLPTGGNRTNNSPFQLSTTPEFTCGAPITLRLEVQSSSQGAYTVPVVLAQSGSAGTAVRVDNSTAVAIPGVGQISRTFAVSGISIAVARVEVSVHITHPRSRELDLTLVSPDGTQVLLASFNGSNSDTNYGISCTDGSRTHFSDSALTSINSAIAPYVGSFNPEQALASFIGKTGTNVNGTWTLVIEDTSGGGMSGSFQCASLFVSPIECTPGGGLCELCPNTTLTGYLGAGSLQHSNRIIMDSNISTCGVPKINLFITGGPVVGSRYYAAHVFQNGPAAACLTATLDANGPAFMFAVYTNSFNPLDIGSNYLTDSGFFTSAPLSSGSFNIAANQKFVVVVSGYDSTEVGDYTLSVTGGDCRPALRITPAGSNAILEWTTAALGYGLESTNQLGVATLVWPAITNAPVIVNSRYQVTNAINSTNQFFRLRKP